MNVTLRNIAARRRAWPVLAALVLLACVAMAQRRNPRTFDYIEDQGWGSWNGVLTGRITDRGGRPIAGARVRVHSKDMETRTDRNGFFTFRGLQQGGRYSVIVDARGYDDALLRWIPIPRTHSADIGDYYLEELTNFWQVTSNVLANGAWAVMSNLVEIAGSHTGTMTHASWVTSSAVETDAGEQPMLLEQPDEAAEPGAAPEPVQSGEPAAEPEE